MNVVFIYGRPGVGKLTVARELATLTGYKLFDNHTRFAFAQRLFDFGTEQFAKLELRLSNLILDTAIEAGVSIIATFVAPTPSVISFLEPHLAAIASNGGGACFVELYCDAAVNEQRIEAPGRAELGKLTRVDALRRILATVDFRLDLPAYPALRIDNTHLPPTAVARNIAAHFALNPTSSRELDS